MGPSGSGKTTLFRLASGELTPDGGEVLIDDQDLTTIGPAKVRRTVVARVHQDYRLIPYLSALDNVQLPLEISGKLRGQEDRSLQVLKQLGLRDHVSARADTLSGGEQQRVAIARCLVRDPHIILADEPTGALDELATSEISALLATVAHDMNLVVIVATHDPNVAVHADVVWRIHDRSMISSSFSGHVQAAGTDGGCS